MALHPEQLEKDTRTLLYEILEPLQRKAVVRELFKDTVGARTFVVSHKSEFLDSVSEKVVASFRSGLSKLQAREAFLSEFHQYMHGCKPAGWRWNEGKYKFVRNNHHTGNEVQKADKARELAERQEKAERKRALVAFDEEQQTLKRKKRSQQ